MAEKVIKCLFCELPSKYSCPQCSVRYCSAACYNNEQHLQCSENFYKQQVLKELKGMKGSTSEKQKVIEMLTKLNKTEKLKDDYQNENLDDISERLSGVHLDDFDEVWERLTESEKNMFQKRIQSGNLDFINIWTPWWTTDKTRSKVEEVCNGKDIKKNITNQPKIKKDLPQLKDILHNKDPDCNLKYSVLEVLLVYIYIKRLFNGDILDSPKEAIHLLLELSGVLSENTAYSDLQTVLFTFLNNVERRTDLIIDPVSICFTDLILILQSNESFVLKAVSDLYLFLKTCRKFMKSDLSFSSHCFKATKKVYFLAAYCKEYEKSIKLMSEEVFEIQLNIVKEREILKKQQKDINSNLEMIRPRKEPLIQEL